MSRVVFSFVFMLVCGSCLSQQTHSLVDGASIQMTGIVGFVARGNNAYIVIRPGKTYTAVFDSNDKLKVREIGLTLEGQWDALKAAVGHRVRVSGVIQLEPTSPYYLNGTLIVAKSVRLANGSVLTPKIYTRADPPLDLIRFHSLVMFSPRTAERWSYTTWDDNGHLLASSAEYLSCSLNGPGDVMNCFCADGFTFTAAGRISGGRFTKTEDPQEGFDFAQFGIDDPVRHSVKKAVECTRSSSAKIAR